MKKFLLFFVITTVCLSGAVFAQASGLGEAGGILSSAVAPTGLKGDLPANAGMVVNTILALVGTIFFGLMIYAGFLWMTAAGTEERVTKAKDILSTSIIGLIILMSAYAITYFVTTKLGVTSGGVAGSAGGAGQVGAVNSMAQCAANGGGCVPSGQDPCDPDGLADDDPYSGTVMGLCDEGQVCCEFKESAGDGLTRCGAMGGRCLSNCPSQGFVQNGECDYSGIGADLCCVPQ